LDHLLAIDILLPTRDVVADELGHIRVVAHNNKDRRGLAALAGGRFLPQSVGLLVVAIQALKARFKLVGQLGFACDRLGAAAFLGQLFPDPHPEVAVCGLVTGHGIVGHGHPGHLDDAAFDSVDEGEVGNDPGEKGPLAIAGAAQEEGRGRQVVDDPDTSLGLDILEA